MGEDFEEGRQRLDGDRSSEVSLAASRLFQTAHQVSPTIFYNLVKKADQLKFDSLFIVSIHLFYEIVHFIIHF